MICNQRRRKDLFIDLSDESKFTYVKRVFDERSDFSFSPENFIITSDEVNAILFITVGHCMANAGRNTLF